MVTTCDFSGSWSSFHRLLFICPITVMGLSKCFVLFSFELFLTGFQEFEDTLMDRNLQLVTFSNEHEYS